MPTPRQQRTAGARDAAASVTGSLPAPPPRPGPGRRARRRLAERVPGKRLLVYFLGVNAVVLSADALVAYALGPPPGTRWGGLAEVTAVIPPDTLLPRVLLAVLWAAEVDGFGWAGWLGIRHDPGDWRAWVMALVGSVASIAFQVFHIWPIIGRAVAPAAWVGAALVLEVPRKRRGPAPVASGVATGPAPATSPGPEVAPRPARGNPAALSVDQRRLARTLHSRGLSQNKVRAGMREAGLGVNEANLAAYLKTLPAPPEPAQVAGNGASGQQPEGGGRPAD